ncbi:MAG: hypothetical protein IKN21_01195, partial [Prevotella sp.]|nr:hypothetical protein [Prevotella sp.]
MSYSTNYVSFDNASGAHYNCGNANGGLQFRTGAGGWSVYAAYGPIYKNITIDCKEGDVSMSGYPLQSDYRIGGTFEAPVFPGKKLVDGAPTSVTIDQDNMSITFNYEASTFDYTLVVNNAPEGITITIKDTEA